MRALKVVVTVPWAERFGGAEQMLLTFLRHVDVERIEPVIAFHARGPFVDEVSALGVRTVVLPSFRLRNPVQIAYAIAALARLLRRERPDFVLAWTTKTQVTTALAALGSGLARRTAWWQQGNATRELLDRFAAVLPARGTICYSEFSAISQRALWPHRPTLVVNPGTDAPPTRPGSVRADLGIPESAFVVGIVARLHPMKRQDVVLRAIRVLIDREVDARALVVGGTAHGIAGEFALELHALVRDLGVEHAVTFTGHVPDATVLLPAMDVLANVSHEEPFGIGLLEAMAAGVPVLACRDSGSAEAVGDAGVLLDNADIDSLVDALARLAADDVNRRDLARRGRERYEAHFTAAAASRRVQDALAELSRLR